MNTQPKLLDTVALLQDLPQDRLTLTEVERDMQQGLLSGTEGTIVHIHDQSDPFHYLVEFADSQGCEYAMATLQKQEFLILSVGPTDSGDRI